MLNETTSIFKIIIAIQKWFNEIDFEEQMNILSLFDNGSILSTLNEENEEIAELVNELIISLEDIYKHEGTEYLESTLKRHGLTDSVLINAIKQYVENKSSMYLSSTLLRELDNETFTLLIESVIKHYYVERNHMSPKKIYRELDLDIDQKEIVLSCRLIDYSINSLYNHRLSYLSFNKFLIEEMGLSRQKAEIFKDLIKRFQSEIDRFIILKNIMEIKRELMLIDN
ncbi:hypothetical protein ABET41_10820 [Metabacillus fastidiosus]|uniref:Uncharacterized protein n=1 Tax=Metabacillus fastidiosus TaxID=1458 RepID=A0ABU6NUK7_9BACI|nr:hypothetical protein [Metabacillus fastidiosus]